MATVRARNLVVDCPHCSVRARLDMRFWVAEPEFSAFSMLYECQNCHGIVFFSAWARTFSEPGGRGEPDQIELRTQYPTRVIKPHEAIPTDIAEDFVEAGRCFDIEAYKAAAVICRRALQLAVRELGAKGDRLLDEIDSLADSHRITPELKEWAHQIRLIGNDGAHADKEGLKTVTEEDAEAVSLFTSEFFHYVYEMPAEVAKRKAQTTPRALGTPP